MPGLRTTHSAPEKKTKIDLGFGGFGLTGLVAAIVAYDSTPVFTGWVGAGKALLVGAGASIGGGLLAIPGAIAGAVVGGILGFATGSRKAAAVGAASLAVLGGLGGYGYGVYEGYGLSKKWLLEGTTIKQSFNDAAKDAAPVQVKELTFVPKAPQFTFG